jgi:hypothetical protein
MACGIISGTWGEAGDLAVLRIRDVAQMRGNKTPFLKRAGVEIFLCFKGDLRQRYFYALLPSQQVEGTEWVFDIRRSPKTYLSGLSVEIDTSRLGEWHDKVFTIDGALFTKCLDDEQRAHEAALCRAIDDDYDFLSATKGSYNWLQRLLFGKHRPRSPLNM